MHAVTARRSIRKYRSDEVPLPYIEEILKAGTLAPSSKNRQPWRFTVVQGKAKKEMLSAMERGLNRERKNPLLPGSVKLLKGAEYTLSIMKQAPVIIFVVNRNGTDIRKDLDTEERIYEICNAQSIGAAIENMTLTATELGLGSLWICDTYFAYEELTEWLGTEGALYAALAVGYADESPAPRPRKDINSITEWR
ncbi:MAG TPA: nitroreductase family protein [Candidatus Mediterraneibacter surreyensis]|nr:nitroreductase family protein [Candidatus Mediterraneibacter surreyensis]